MISPKYLVMIAIDYTPTSELSREKMNTSDGLEKRPYVIANLHYLEAKLDEV